LETIVVDGNDVLSVYVATKMAAERARTRSEPAFLECVTYKMKGHGVYDKGEYRPKDEVEKWLNRDPISLFEKRLADSKAMTTSELQTTSDEVNQEMEEAVKFAMQGPVLPFDTITDYVYAR